MFSIYFTRLFIPTNITPNQITVMSVLVFFAGIAAVMVGNLVWGLIGCLLIFFSIILDGCDGEIARYKKNGSVAGTLFVEPVSHDVQYGLMFPLLGLGSYLQSTSVEAWTFIVLGFIAGIAKLLFRLLEVRMWNLTSYMNQISDEKIEEIKRDYTEKAPHIRLVYWINKNIFSSTGVFVVLLVAVLFSQVELYIYLYALGYTGLWLLLFGKQMYKVSKKKY